MNMNVYSIGRLSQMFQRSPCQLRAAFEELGVKPTLTVNDIGHYSAAAVERLQRHFKKGKTMTNNETARLERENKRLRNRVKNLPSGSAYIRRVEALVNGGMPRAKAAAQAAREHPKGRKAFLKLTNSEAVCDVLDTKPKIIRR